MKFILLTFLLGSSAFAAATPNYSCVSSQNTSYTYEIQIFDSSSGEVTALVNGVSENISESTLKHDFFQTMPSKKRIQFIHPEGDVEYELTIQGTSISLKDYSREDDDSIRCAKLK